MAAGGMLVRQGVVSDYCIYTVKHFVLESGGFGQPAFFQGLTKKMRSQPAFFQPLENTPPKKVGALRAPLQNCVCECGTGMAFRFPCRGQKSAGWLKNGDFYRKTS